MRERRERYRQEKERKEREVFILLLPCSLLRLLNLLLLQPKKKMPLRHPKELLKAQVAAVNVVLGGILAKVAPH